MDYKVGLPITIQYVALKKTAGLTDLTFKSYNPSEVLVDTIVMTEVGGGVYKAVFTPALVGQWRIDIASVVNGDSAGKVLEIEAYNIGDVKSGVDTVGGKVDAVKTELDAVQSAVGVTDGKVDTLTTKSDAIKTELDTVNGKADTITTNVAAVKTELDTVNGNVSAIKSKTDNLPVDTAGALTAIQSAVNGVAAQINVGGYIL